MQEFNLPGIIDIIAIVVVLAGALRGYFRGLSGELARLVSMILSMALGIVISRPMGAWFCAHTRLSEPQARVFAFLSIVVVVLLTMVVVRVVLKHIMQVIFNKKVDRIGGVIAGTSGAVLFVLMVFLMMIIWPNEYLNRKFGEESITGRMMISLMPDLEDEGAEELIDRAGEQARDYAQE